MNIYKADLHIHTVLSPCGDLEMSPVNIIHKACEKKLDIIGITDHNSTLHCELIRRLAAPHGILVLMGAEITTREEIHCLTFFETMDQLREMQDFIHHSLPDFRNDPEKFGHQVVVNEKEEIIYTEERLLTTALPVSLEELEHKVHALDGLFIPAHIDKSRFSILSQLGFIPGDLRADGFEIMSSLGSGMVENFRKENGYTAVLKNSDAHYPDDIGKNFNQVLMNKLTFQEFRNALMTADRITA